MSVMFGGSACAATNNSSCANYAHNVCTYDAAKAVEYAQTYYNTTSEDFFLYYASNNCTNFVSQAIAAGLTGKTTQSEVRNRIPHYNVEIGYSSDYQKWHYRGDSHSLISQSWLTANTLYKYVQNQAMYSTYRGLHFTFVTDDSPTRALDFSKIKNGDIIFADWGYNTYAVDGYIDHVMIVTQKTGNSCWYQSYLSIWRRQYKLSG